MFNCAFIYIFEGLDPARDRAVIPAAGEEGIAMNVTGCSTYEQAEIIAKEMVELGCGAIELCAGFGNDGAARIQKAVGPDIPVGAVRFDLHPAMGHKSGDAFF